jgi:hypothetical protein
VLAIQFMPFALSGYLMKKARVVKSDEKYD